MLFWKQAESQNSARIENLEFVFCSVFLIYISFHVFKILCGLNILNY